MSSTYSFTDTNQSATELGLETGIIDTQGGRI